MNRRSLLIVSAILSFHISTVFSQQISFNAIHYKPEKTVLAFLGITEDPLGNIWLASFRGGIYRYDGTGFINFAHSDSNTNSLANDWTDCILADSSGLIWIGTHGWGMDRLVPVTNSFTHFRHDPKNNASIANDTVSAILTDHAGILWIGTHGGLDMFDPPTGKFIHYVHRSNDKKSLSSNDVRSIYEDHRGTIWIGCGTPFSNEKGGIEDGGLNRFNSVKGNFTRYLHDPADPGSLTANKVKALFEDSKGNFWVGTMGDGLHIMDREKGNFTHYYYNPEHPENLSRSPLIKAPIISPL